jgi:phosphoglycolate phosphatase-like HAD superfamily hydrolase
MLVLFDIDGTLLRTDGAGLRAMEDAGRDLFSASFHYEGIETAGRLDTLIWKDLARLNGIEDSPEIHERFRQRYHEHLARRLEADGPARLLPGVRELVMALVNHNRGAQTSGGSGGGHSGGGGSGHSGGVSIGLLTGNYPETGRLKIASAGLEPDVFLCNAWGCEGASRRDLPPIAMRRHREILGRAIEPQEVVIIGDTPHDIDCARAHGCRSLAVATGAFELEDLRGHQPDIAVEDLADGEAIMGWLMQSSAVNTA